MTAATVGSAISNHVPPAAASQRSFTHVSCAAQQCQWHACCCCCLLLLLPLLPQRCDACKLDHPHAICAGLPAAMCCMTSAAQLATDHCRTAVSSSARACVLNFWCCSTALCRTCTPHVHVHAASMHHALHDHCGAAPRPPPLGCAVHCTISL